MRSGAIQFEKAKHARGKKKKKFFYHSRSMKDSPPRHCGSSQTGHVAELHEGPIFGSETLVPVQAVHGRCKGKDGGVLQ